MMKFEGRGPGLFNAGGGTIELFENNLVINKKNTDLSGGALGMAFNAVTASKGGFTIPYESISSVNISEGGWTAPPFIQILTNGSRLISDSTEAMKDPSCLLFKKADKDDVHNLKKEIEKRVAEAKRPTGSTGPSAADELLKFSNLLKSGIISQEEFDQKKKALLGI
jgi:hypothetical protein